MLPEKSRVKKIIVTVSLLFIVHFSKAQSDVETVLRNMDLHQYLGKPIDTLLAYIPASYDSLHVTSSDPMYMGAGLIIEYVASDIMIHVEIRGANYITRPNPNHLPPEQAWPLPLLRKENVGEITVYKSINNIINTAAMF